MYLTILGAVLAALLAALIAHKLTTSRDDRNAYRSKANEFKELLAPFLRALESPHAHPATLIGQTFEQHDVAARKVRLHMKGRKAKRFDDKWAAYAALHQEKQSQGLLGLFATEVDDLAKATPHTAAGQEYMLDQSKKRRQQAIDVIQAALRVL
jgi:hypothetical protein